MLAIGDKVEIMGPLGNSNAVKFGKIVQINTRTKPDSQPVGANIPEPVYSVKLDTGEVVHYLREQQLKKL
jgi:hypothetical protein